MITEFSELIDELDKTLASVTRLWLDPESASKTDEIMETIDKGLDRRKSLMDKRDLEKPGRTFFGMAIDFEKDTEFSKDTKITFGDFNDYKNWPRMN